MDMQKLPGNGATKPSIKPAIEDGIQLHIGRQLKASYEQFVLEPVPERFRELLDALQRGEKKS